MLTEMLEGKKPSVDGARSEKPTRVYGRLKKRFANIKLNLKRSSKQKQPSQSGDPLFDMSDQPLSNHALQNLLQLHQQQSQYRKSDLLISAGPFGMSTITFGWDTKSYE